MPPKKKHTNSDIPNILQNAEWIPGSKMVFESPNTDFVSRSRRATQRFTRSVQSFEKEDFARIEDLTSLTYVSSPGVKTRLRRQSFIAGKNIPNVSLSVSITHQTSETPTNLLLNTRKTKGLKRNTEMEVLAKKPKTSSKVDEVKTTNLLDTNEIIALIDNLSDNRKHKSDISIVYPDEKPKNVKFDIEHTENYLNKRRSPRIARIKTAKTLKEDNYLKAVKKPKKQTKEIENDESLAGKRTKINMEEEETDPKKGTREKRKCPLKNEIEKHQEKKSPTSNRPPHKKQSNRNTKISDNQKMEVLKTLEDRNERTTKDRKFQECSQEISNRVQKSKSLFNKSIRKDEFESQINEKNQERRLSTRNRTLCKRQSTRNTKLDLGKEEEIVVEIKPQEVMHTSKVIENENETKKVYGKLATITKSTAEMLTSKTNVPEEKHTEFEKNSFENVNFIPNPDDDKKEGRNMKNSQVKEIVDDSPARRVTRQMVSAEKIISEQNQFRKDLLQKGGKKSSLKKPRGTTEFEPEIVVDFFQLSSIKSKNINKCGANKKSRINSSPLHTATPSKITKKIISPNASSKVSQRKPTPRRGVGYRKANEKKNNTNPDSSAKVGIENKPEKSTRGIKFLSKTHSERQNTAKENVESCNWSLKGLFKDFGQKTTELASKDGEATKLVDQVSETGEIFNEKLKQKVPSKSTGFFSAPLLSSTPDIVKKTHANKLHKTVSNLSPLSLHKTFEYTRTSIASAYNQTIKESVLLQKVEQSKMNNENIENKIDIKDDEIQMNVDAEIMSKKAGEFSLKKQVHLACQESRMERDKTSITNDEDDDLDSIDVGLVAAVPVRSDNELSNIQKNVYYESQSEAELVVDVNEKYLEKEEEDLPVVAKSIHYESQQSEDESHNMSQDDPEEIFKGMLYDREEDEKVKNLLFDDIKFHSDSNQSDVDIYPLHTTGKEIHYESQQSDILNTREEEHDSDTDFDYNASYSSYGLRCVIL